MDKKYLPRPDNTRVGVAINDETSCEITIVPCIEKYLEELNERWGEEGNMRYVTLGYCLTTYKIKYWVDKDDLFWIDSEENQ